MRSMMIPAVQVGIMAAVVPPCPFILHGTVVFPVVVVLIFGCEWNTAVLLAEGVASGSC